jgi:DNA-binding transcriptional LysR family regulator
MDLNARPIRCFIAVAEGSSFSRAGLRMHMSQPAVSAQIRALERQLGFDLFVRTSRQVELTAEGRLFLGTARRFVGEAVIFNRAARDIRMNEIRIGAAVETALIPERTTLIEQFIESNPHTCLQIVNEGQAAHFSSLANRDVDIAIVIESEEQPTSEGAATDGFERLCLCHRPVALLVPRDNPLSELSSIPLKVLKGMRIVVPHRLGDAIDTSELTSRLTLAGAHVVRPPEDNSIAVEQFAFHKRIAAISLGWIKSSATEFVDNIRRPVLGLEFSTFLNLIRVRGSHRAAAEHFWNSVPHLGLQQEPAIEQFPSPPAAHVFGGRNTVTQLRPRRTAPHR